MPPPELQQPAAPPEPALPLPLLLPLLQHRQQRSQRPGRARGGLLPQPGGRLLRLPGQLIRRGPAALRDLKAVRRTVPLLQGR